MVEVGKTDQRPVSARSPTLVLHPLAHASKADQHALGPYPSAQALSGGLRLLSRTYQALQFELG